MEEKKNLCAPIPLSLHQRLRAEQEQRGQTLSDYITDILKEHFDGGTRTMNTNTRTIAFQVPEELFERLKDYLARNGLLKNEKYKGDAILQKSYTTESFPRKRKNNHGERNAYYMEGSHAAIISDVDFETVQKIRVGRKRSTEITNTVLRGALYCCCKSPLRMRMSGQSVYWVCIRHSHNTSACPITQIPEAQIQQAFLRLYYNLKHQGSHILADLIANLQSIRERKFLWSVDVIELNKQIAELTRQNQLLATLRESGCVDPDIFISKSNKLTEQLRAVKQAKSRILNQDGDDTIPCTQELITILKRGPETLHDFDGELFGQLIDKVIIESNTSLRFRLKNGLELRESIERTVR